MFSTRLMTDCASGTSLSAAKSGMGRMCRKKMHSRLIQSAIVPGLAGGHPAVPLAAARAAASTSCAAASFAAAAASADSCAWRRAASCGVSIGWPENRGCGAWASASSAACFLTAALLMLCALCACPPRRRGARAGGGGAAAAPPCSDKLASLGAVGSVSLIRRAVSVETVTKDAAVGEGARRRLRTSRRSRSPRAPAWMVRLAASSDL